MLLAYALYRSPTVDLPSLRRSASRISPRAEELIEYSSSSFSMINPRPLPNVCDCDMAAERLERTVRPVDALEREREMGRTGRVYLSSSLPPTAAKRLERRVAAQLALLVGAALTRDEHCEADRGHSSSAALEAALALKGDGSEASEPIVSDRADGGRGQLAMFARAPVASA